MLLAAGAAGTAADQPYYCLEAYRPVGALLRDVPVPPAPAAARDASARGAAAAPLQHGQTSGQVARLCAAACDGDPACSGFRAVGPEAAAAAGPACQLLANATAALPAALALVPGHPWPRVNDNVTSIDGVPLRSLSWMCWRRQEAWDAFGAATHNVIMAGSPAAPPPPASPAAGHGAYAVCGCGRRGARAA
jgi:hypothetical protein